MPKAEQVKSDTPDADGGTAFAHMFRTPIAFASGGDDVRTGLKVSIEHPTTDAPLRAERKPSRGARQSIHPLSDTAKATLVCGGN